MSKFEFVTVLVSIVVAFAMAELLLGWGRLLRLTPEIRQDAAFDLQEHYYSVKRSFIVLAVLFLLAGLAADAMLPSFPDTWVTRATPTGVIIATLLLLFVRRRYWDISVMVLNLSWLLSGALLADVMSV